MAIVRKEAYYDSSNGRNIIRALLWQDDQKTPVGVFQIAHGVSEHIGRYDEFARYLASNGFIVCGNDHLGHGKSVNTVSELGYIDPNDGWKFMIADMHALYHIMHKRHPELPYFMFGHSMGSFCARIYSAAYGDDLAGAIYCGTGQLPQGLFLLKDPLNFILDKLPPDSANDTMSVLFGKFSGKLMYGEDDPRAWISKNKENRECYNSDPLSGFPLKPGGMKNLIALALKSSEPDWASKLPEHFPVMLISGAKDPVGFSGRGVLNVADELVKVDIDPTVILYPGDRHEILNEDDRETVYADVLKWLRSVLNNTSFYD